MLIYSYLSIFHMSFTIPFAIPYKRPKNAITPKDKIIKNNNNSNI